MTAFFKLITMYRISICTCASFWKSTGNFSPLPLTWGSHDLMLFFLPTRSLHFELFKGWNIRTLIVSSCYKLGLRHQKYCIACINCFVVWCSSRTIKFQVFKLAGQAKFEIGSLSWLVCFVMSGWILSCCVWYVNLWDKLFFGTNYHSKNLKQTPSWTNHPFPKRNPPRKEPFVVTGMLSSKLMITGHVVSNLFVLIVGIFQSDIKKSI